MAPVRVHRVIHDADDIGVFLVFQPGHQIVLRQHVLTHDPPRLPDPQGRGHPAHAEILEFRKIGLQVMPVGLDPAAALFHGIRVAAAQKLLPIHRGQHVDVEVAIRIVIDVGRRKPRRPPAAIRDPGGQRFYGWRGHGGRAVDQADAVHARRRFIRGAGFAKSLARFLPLHLLAAYRQADDTVAARVHKVIGPHPTTIREFHRMDVLFIPVRPNAQRIEQHAAAPGFRQHFPHRLGHGVGFEGDPVPQIANAGGIVAHALRPMTLEGIEVPPRRIDDRLAAGIAVSFARRIEPERVPAKRIDPDGARLSLQPKKQVERDSRTPGPHLPTVDPAAHGISTEAIGPLHEHDIHAHSRRGQRGTEPTAPAADHRQLATDLRPGGGTRLLAPRHQSQPKGRGQRPWANAKEQRE